MDSSTMLMEGGEWTSFNGVSVNEEADFMAKMFPKSSFNNGVEMSSSLSQSSSFYSGNELKIGMSGDESSSFYSNDSNSNLSLSQGSSLSNHCNEIYFLSDPDQFLAVNNDNSLPVGFCLDTKGCIQAFPGNLKEKNHNLNVEISCDNLDGMDMDLKQSQKSQLNTKLEMSEIESHEDDKNIDLLQRGKKRSQKSEVDKRKRNVRSKRNRKLDSDDDEDNSLALNKQNSSSCISEDLSGGNSNVSAIDNPNVKTRASRGSAVDPQSLYARKRRERINERLKILQSLIPNGTKVDISTMLEEAVNYVKFLELQIKLLSSDDLWMYAPLAYNGMDIGLDAKINSLLH